MKTASGKKRTSSWILPAAVLLCAAAVLWFILPSGTKMSEKEYFGITKDYEVGVVCQAEKTDMPGRVIDGKLYLDYDSVRAYINPSVWYDAPANLLIVTKPKEIITLDLSAGTTPEREAGFLDGILFISLDYLDSVTNMEISEYDQQVRRIWIQNNWKYDQAVLKKKARIRFAPGRHSKVIEVCEAGTAVRPAPAGGEDSGGKWTRVVTGDGMAGYVETKLLGEPEAVDLTAEHRDPELEYGKRTYDETINMVFHQTDNQASNNALPVSLEGVKGVNVIAPTWFYLDSTDGTVRDVTSRDYVEYAHSEGMEVWAVFNDFDGNCSSPEETLAFLENYEARKKAADAVITSAQACGADGLNLDFELVRERSAEAFLEFVRELSAACGRAGMVLSLDNYVPTYTAYMNRKEQARVADFIVTMCYDEHTAGSAAAGSVASLPFVRKGLGDTLKEVPAGQLIAAGPFFTRLWSTEGDNAPESKALGMRDAKEALALYGMTAYRDEDTGQNYAEIKEGDILRQIWLEDEESVAGRLAIAAEYGCAGFAWWKLGFETSDIWDVISGYCA